jgi:hypothetical protein
VIEMRRREMSSQLRQCVNPDCTSPARGTDIERAFDEEGNPVYCVTFTCASEHVFREEHPRMVQEEVAA